jgi:hypothetical protein
MQLLQHLADEGPNRRTEVCKEFTINVENNENLSGTLFSDEVSICVNGDAVQKKTEMILWKRTFSSSVSRCYL